MRNRHHCRFHIENPLDGRPTVNGLSNENYNRVTRGPHLPVFNTIGLCGHPYENKELGDNWAGNLCDDDVTAERCPLFSPFLTKQELWNNMARDVKDVEWVRENLPELHALLWVLDLAQVPIAPWWVRALARLRLLFAKVAPPELPLDIEKLLAEMADAGPPSCRS